MKKLSYVLEGLASLVALVPGVSAILKPEWWPPESRGVFAVLLEGVAILVLALGFIARRRLVGWQDSRVVRHVTVAGTLGVIFFVGYWIALDTVAQRHYYRSVGGEEVLIPLAPAFWARPKLDSLVACASANVIQCQGVVPERDYSTEGVAQAINEYGVETIRELFPASARRLTLLALFVLAAVSVIGFTYAFGLAGIWLGHRDRVTSEPGNN